jgi:hypothetical protein
MTWHVEIKAAGDTHMLEFDTKDEADAALQEAQNAMVQRSRDPVRIAGQLVVSGMTISSAKAWET